MVTTCILLAMVLAMPSTAWAGNKVQMDPNTLGALLAAVLTSLGGGGWYLQRMNSSKAGRDDLSAKTRAAIARDNADQVLREKIADYTAGLEGLRNDVQQLQQLCTRAIQTAETVREDLRQHKDDTAARFRDVTQQHQLDRLLQPLADLEYKLTRAIELTERKGGGYGGA
jgi:DNA anti-recombination protein RmuC